MVGKGEIYASKSFINSLMSQDKVFKLLPELWFFADSPHGLPLQKAMLFGDLPTSFNIDLGQRFAR